MNRRLRAELKAVAKEIAADYQESNQFEDRLHNLEVIIYKHLVKLFKEWWKE